MAHHGCMSKFKSMFFFMAHMIFSLKFNNNSFYLSMVTFMFHFLTLTIRAFQNPYSYGGGPKGENRVYRPYFCMLTIKNHIKGLKGNKNCPQQGP